MNFKPCPGYELEYVVTDCGRIFSLPRPWRRQMMEIFPSVTHRGYHRVNLSKRGGKPRKHYFHRLIASAFVPEVAGKNEVNHIDGNKLNNRADNLEWVTRSENERHAYRSGLKTAPNRIPDSVRASVVNMRIKGAPRAAVLAAHGISASAFSQIMREYRGWMG